MPTVVRRRWAAGRPACVLCGQPRATLLVTDHLNRPLGTLCPQCVPTLDRAMDGRLNWIDSTTGGPGP